MGSSSPIVVALGIVALVAFVGLIIAYARRNSTFRGYEEMQDAARAIARSFRGDVFRDGEDLVVAGNMESFPVTVRFSQQENTPGMTIRMEAPATFQMTVVPQGSPLGEGKALLRTGDAQFDSRFTSRTDQPTQARMLLGSRGIAADMQKLCCSTKTFVSIAPGAVETAELLIPEQYLDRHVNEHLNQMARIARALQQLPGAEAVKIKPIRRERFVLARTAIAIGLVAAVGTVVAAYDNVKHPPALAAEPAPPAGISLAEAAQIPGVAQWRVARREDFDPAALNWARSSDIGISGRIAADFSGRGDGRDAAYLLRRADGAFRVVILAEGSNRFDLNYDNLALAVRVPRAAFESIQWAGKAPENPAGDGLLIAYKRGDAAASVIVFLSGDRTRSATPANYQALRF